MKQSLRALALSIPMLAALTGCTTLGFTSAAKKDGSRNYTYATVVQQAGNDDPAIAKLGRKEWIDLRKSSKDAHLRMFAALGASEWDVAAQEARGYLKSHPKDLGALRVLATALVMKNDYDLAAYYASLIEKYHPGDPEAYNLKALAVLHRSGANIRDFRKAAHLFEQAFNSSSTQIASGLNLGHLYLEMGDATKAARVFQDVKGRCNDCTESLMGLGIAQSRLRQFNSARATLSEVLDRHPNHAQALYRLALVEENGYNDTKQAKKYLERLLADAPESEKDLKRRANHMLRRIEARDYAPAMAEDPSDAGNDADAKDLLDANFEGE